MKQTNSTTVSCGLTFPLLRLNSFKNTSDSLRATWANNKAKRENVEELNVTSHLGKIQDYKINWMKNVKSIPRDSI